MTQHTFNVSNGDGATVRQGFNAAVVALATKNASAVAPSTTFQFMSYWDPSADVAYVRNEGNSAWINMWAFTASTVVPYVKGVLLDAPVQYDMNQTFTKAQRALPASVTYASSLALNMNNGNNFKVSPLTGNLTLANPSAMASATGQSGSVWLRQDGTGSRSVSFGSMWKFAGGTPPTASTASGATDRLDYKVRNASTIDAALTLAVA